tara:strand:+ start:14 stop:325 length:312 start_codon:yes stop_codon:yes gene_type:complete
MENKRTTIEDFQKLKDSIINHGGIYGHGDRFADFMTGLVTGVVVMQEINNREEQLDELLFQSQDFCDQLVKLPSVKANIDGLMTMLFDKPISGTCSQNKRDVF